MRSALVIAAGLLLACSGTEDAPPATVNVVVASAPAGLTASSVARIHVEASPAGAGIDLTYSPVTDAFSGTLSVPPGVYLLSATAYASDIIVGNGAASVTVAAHATASVSITIYDSSGAPNVRDHPPYILFAAISNTKVQANDSVTLTALALDPDDDPVTYAWTHICPAGLSATFESPSSATTTWRSAPFDAALNTLPEGSCTIYITATSNGLSDTKYFNVLVVNPVVNGTIVITGQYVPQPWVYAVRSTDLSPAGTRYVYRTRGVAGFLEPALPGQRVAFEALLGGIVPSVPPVITVSDDCGGRFTLGPGAYPKGGVWTAPAEPAVCTVSFAVQVGILRDSFPVSILVTTPGAPSLTVLTYHHMLPATEKQAGPYADDARVLSLERFEEHMAYLVGQGYTALTEQQILAIIRGEQPIPPKSVFITFDDGHRSTYLHAYPVLKKYGLHATVFLITSRISDHAHAYDSTVFQYLSWDEIALMSDVFTFGGHTHNLHSMNAQSVSALLFTSFDASFQDLATNRSLLSGGSLFAYPFGQEDNRAVSLVDLVGFGAAFVVGDRKYLAGVDRFHIPRFSLTENDTVEVLAALVSEW